jgi:histidyl-tRNA synthetase
LEEAAQRLYKEWFVDLRFPGYENTPITDGVPQGWKKERLVDIADVQYGFAFDGSLFNADGNGMPIIRIRNIPDGITKDYTTEEADEQYIVKNGDIVVGMDGEFHINSWSGEDSYLVQRTCRIKPHNADMNGYAAEVAKKMEACGIRVNLDDRNETMGKRIREAQLEKIPYMLIVGAKEQEQVAVSVRNRKGEDLGVMSISDMIVKFTTEINEKIK